MRLRVQLPTRWVRIDLAGDVDAQIDEFLAARLLTVPPRQRTALARTLEPLRQGYRSLGDTAALMVASPVYPVDGRSAHPQLVFLPFDPPEGQTPLDAVLAVASTDASAALLDLPDVVALRTSSSVPIPEQSVGSGTPGRDLDGGGAAADDAPVAVPRRRPHPAARVAHGDGRCHPPHRRRRR